MSVGHLKALPDGGWGWCVVGAGFITQFVVVGLQNSSGVVFKELVSKYNKSRGETGFVSSISVAMMFLLGPLVTWLSQRFGCRKIGLAGATLCISGLIASAFAPSLQAMYVTFGVMWGLGTSFCYFPTMIILVGYFDERLALANGIVASGSGIGTLALSPFLQWFAREFGVENAFLMLAGLHFIVFLVAFAYRPLVGVQRHHEDIITDESSSSSGDTISCEEQLLKHEEKDSFSHNIRQLATNKAFVVWCIALAVFIMGYFVPFVHLVSYAGTLGIPELKAAFLISTLSVSATFFKVITGRIASCKRVNKLRMYQLGLTMIGVSTFLVPLVLNSYAGLMVYSVLFGFGESVFIVMIPLIARDIVGVKRLPLALGCVFMVMGVPACLGVPVAGWIYDYFQAYPYAFYLAGSANCGGVLIMLFVSCFQQPLSPLRVDGGAGIRSVELMSQRRKLCIEEIKRRPESMVVEYTFYGSSQRIFYSEVETKELEGVISEHHKRLAVREHVMSTTSLYKNNTHDKFSHKIPGLLHNAENIFIDGEKISNKPLLSGGELNYQRWSLHIPAEKPTERSLVRNSVHSNVPEIRIEQVDGTQHTLKNGLSVTVLNDDKRSSCVIEFPRDDDTVVTSRITAL